MKWLGAAALVFISSTNMSNFALAQTAALAAAQYPNRAIRIVVPCGRADDADTLARVLGAVLHKTWGQSIVIDNMPGMGGSVGANAVAQARADGYTLLLGYLGMLYAHRAHEKKDRPANADYPLQPWRDFVPVALLAEEAAQMTISWASPPEPPGGFPGGRQPRNPVSPLEMPHWYGLVAPHGTPPDIVEKLNLDIKNAMQSSAVTQHLMQTLKNKRLMLTHSTSVDFGLRIQGGIQAFRQDD
jgi:tripartite-type tricarboxylate transporter receptor subunit TctC